MPGGELDDPRAGDDDARTIVARVREAVVRARDDERRNRGLDRRAPVAEREPGGRCRSIDADGLVDEPFDEIGP